MRMAIGLLGGFRVEVDGVPIPGATWRHRRGADLVKILALEPAHRMHREQVMDALWPELAADAAGANLRKAIHFARRALGRENAIRSDRTVVELAPGDIVVDVHVFQSEARAAREVGTAAASAAAATHYGGELLPEDRYAPWCEAHRERLRLAHLDLLRAAGRWDLVLEHDGADEEAHRALMMDALSRGDRHAVIRQFERLRDALRLDLGLGPGPESIEVYERALTMHEGQIPTPDEQARAVLARALVAKGAGVLDEAEMHAEAARGLSITAGSSRLVGESSALLGMVALQRGSWRERFRAEFEASLRHAPEMASAVFDAHLCLADVSLYGAEGHEEIAPFARELLGLAEEARSTHGRAIALLLLGEVELLSGRLGHAVEHLSRSRDLHDRAGAESGYVLAIERLGEAALAGGDRARAELLLRDVLPRAGSSRLAPHLVPRVQGGLVDAASDEGTARDVILRADRRPGSELCPPCSMSYRIAATKAQALAGDLPHAHARLAEAERIAGMWQGGPWLAAVWEARGFIRRAEGNEAQAAALFAEAADLFGRAGRVLEQARCVSLARSPRR